MSSRNDEIQSQAEGFMSTSWQDPVSMRASPPGDRRTTVTAVAQGTNLYFDSLDDVLAWCDSEQSRRG